MSYYVINTELEGIGIYFDKAPETNTREYLKSVGFRWNNKKKCWYNRNNPETLEIAKSISDGEQRIDRMQKIQENHDQEAKKGDTGLEEKRTERKEKLIYENKDTIVSFERKKDISLQLNKLTLSDGKVVFNLGEWNNETPQKTISFSDEEFREIVDAYNSSKEKCRSDTEAYHKNETIFEYEYFNIIYRGIRENKYGYEFVFEVENISNQWLHLYVENLFICNCTIKSYTTIADKLQPSKKSVKDVSISKQTLNKQWIKKIWEHSLIEVEFHFSIAETRNELESWDRETYRIKNLKIAPDFILQT